MCCQNLSGVLLNASFYEMFHCIILSYAPLFDHASCIAEIYDDMKVNMFTEKKHLLQFQFFIQLFGF